MASMTSAARCWYQRPGSLRVLPSAGDAVWPRHACGQALGLHPRFRPLVDQRQQQQRQRRGREQTASPTANGRWVSRRRRTAASAPGRGSPPTPSSAPAAAQRARPGAPRRGSTAHACRWSLRNETSTMPLASHAEHGDEADRRRHRQVLPGDEQPDDAADDREGHVGDDQRGMAHRLKAVYSRMKIRPMVSGTITARRSIARCWFSKAPPHSTQ